MVPMGYLVNTLGEGRWEKIRKHCKRKHKAETLLISYTAKGLVLHANDVRGKRLGTIAEIESEFKPKKKGKKKQINPK